MNVKKFISESGMVVVLLMLVVACSVFVKGFASFENFKNLGLLIATVGMVSCTMLFCLAAGDFDLSVGSVLALGGVVAVIVSNNTGNMLLAVLAAIAVGVLVGLVNGYIIAGIGINALITTLATMQIARGATQMLTGGESLMARTPGFRTLGSSQVFGLIPIPIVIMVLVMVVFGVLLNLTVFGRETLAIGGNPDAAKLAGISLTKRKLMIFALSGSVAAFAGVVSASRLITASNNAGDKLELQAISACVLGGVSLAGGVGSISGVVVGVLIMGIVQNAMSLWSLDSFVQMVVTGVILLVAVVLDKLKSKAMKL